ncbi:MAG TPA: hypothetical protein VNZ26_09705 [Vicinamibacterales bacterium]|nr:hypothetical protein [Vicinamibacterales bacterium]
MKLTTSNTRTAPSLSLIGSACHGVHYLAQDERRYDEALRAHERALALRQEIGDKVNRSRLR